MSHASAFAAGPSFLILLCFLVRKYTKFDPGSEAMKTLFGYYSGMGSGTPWLTNPSRA